MRRAAPAPRLRVDPCASPGLCRVGMGPAGLRLEPAGGGEVAADGPWAQVAALRAGPVVCTTLDAAHGGRLLVGTAPGLVRSINVADLGQMFDRRPAGVDQVVGAARANAALLRADGGWRAVVIPSLGDRLGDLGDGPVAIAPDGLAVAAVEGEAIVVRAMADGAERARHEGAAEAIALDSTGDLWVARGGLIGRADIAPGTGTPITTLRAAGGADVVAGLHEHGAVSVVRDGLSRTWTPPIDADQISVSDDGVWVLLAGPTGVVVCRADDGDVALWVENARCGAMVGDDRVVVSGEWGIATIEPVAAASR